MKQQFRFLDAVKAAATAFTALGALALTSSCAQSQPATPQAPATNAAKPNIVFILADDLGWMDTATYGSKFYQTPNIDKLRQRGMMFTRAYSAHALCSPTRASILTGQHPARVRITAPRGHYAEAVLDVEMPKSAQSSFKAVPAPTRTRLPLGYYTTGQALKDAGYTTGFMGKWHLGDDPYGPSAFGFDTVVGAGPFAGPRSYFSPYKMGKHLPDGPVGEQIDDRMGKEAVKFIEANKDKPFFLNVWSWGVHAPFEGKENYIKDFKAKVDPKYPQQSPTYAAMVKSTDDLVGTVTDTLDRLKLTDKTLLVFFSDNGGNMFDRADGVVPTSNAPLRGGKAEIYDGGTRVPMIVDWPGHVKPNSTSDALISSIDFYPTLLDVAGARGKNGQVVDGVDLRGVWEGKNDLKRDAIYSDFIHYNPPTNTIPSSYVHQGNFKLIRFFADGPKQTDRFELYDLSVDIGETNDLSAKMPAKVAELNALISAHLKETDALVPFANPKYMAGEAKVLGWQPRGDASIRQTASGMEVTSSGTDPRLYYTKLPASSGPYSVKMRVKSDIKGKGAIYWGTLSAPNFNKEAQVEIKLQADNQWHDTDFKVPLDETLLNLRIDPGSNRGEATFEWIRLYDKDDKLVKAWEFAATKGDKIRDEDAE